LEWCGNRCELWEADGRDKRHYGESGACLTSFIIEDYSNDGELVINGQLDLEILASPVTLKGTIQLTGSIESEVVVDMTIDVTADPFVYSGIVAIDGETYSVDE
tara:strand:- start:165 stop:476 length:312 start_codon:yes stop_codon:yes gene_type:complete